MKKNPIHKSSIIINADDFGISKEVNNAIIQLVEKQMVSSTSVMTNMPYYKDITNIKDRVGVGIHLNLTSFKPTEYQYSISDQNGTFYSLPSLLERIRNNKISKQQVCSEFENQVERLMEINILPDHINTHESLMKFPFFFSIVKKIAQKYNIKGVRTYVPRRFDYSRLKSFESSVKSIMYIIYKYIWRLNGFYTPDKIDSILEHSLTYESAIEKLVAIFSELNHGVLELVVHPGNCLEDFRYLGDYCSEREIEYRALLSKQIKRIMLDHNIKLIKFVDILNGQRFY